MDLEESAPIFSQETSESCLEGLRKTTKTIQISIDTFGFKRAKLLGSNDVTILSRILQACDLEDRIGPVAGFC
jgi:hypothetical protein